MANNVTLHQKNKDGAYDNIYPRTTADHTMLTSATGNKYGLTDGSAEQAVSISMDFISTIGAISMYVFDPLGNPVEGAVIQGLSGNPSTNASGFVQGTVVANPVTVKSPYVDLKDKSVNVTSYVGTTTAMRVTLESLGENGIVRFTRSTNVKFSHVTKTVDVCCVGGGGGGTIDAHYPVSGGWSGGSGCGGGGGAIVNGYGLSITALTSYPIIIGNGAAVAISDPNLRGQGGTTSFLTVSAQGGYSGYFERVYGSNASYYNQPHSGAAGATGCGDGGGGSNTTVSEFNDGVTFYSGGGGNGFHNGGSPNGANGVTYASGTSSSYYLVNATTAGIGGGGGGGGGMIIDDDMKTANGSPGGPGLVAIRFHF